MSKFELHPEVHFRTLDALGIRYAALHETDGRGKLLFLTKTEVEKHFGSTFQDLLSDEEASELRAQVDALDLAPDWTELAQKIADYELTDTPIVHDFQLCECGMPLTHGYIVDNNGQTLLRDSVISLVDCIIQTHVMINEGKFDANTGIALMKKVLEHDLAKNEDEEKTRYEALPDEVIAEFERKLNARTPFGIMIIDAGR
jgi:hypothetical protein